MHGTSQVPGQGQISRYNGQTTKKSWFNSRSRTRDIPRLQSVQTISSAHSASYGSHHPHPRRKNEWVYTSTNPKSIQRRANKILHFTFILVKFSLKMMGKGTRGTKHCAVHLTLPSGVPRNFCSGGRGGSTNSVEDRENGDLGAVAPYSGVWEAAVIWYKKFHFI